MVNVVTPPTTTFDYTTTGAQAKLVALTDAVNANLWISPGSVTSWYPQLREWAHACISTHTILSGGVATSCIGRACTDPASGALLFPYCSKLKHARDGSGFVQYDGAGVPISLGADVKTMVLANGAAAPDNTPLVDCYLPPAHFYAYLDQFVADIPTGQRLSANFVWAVPNPIGNLTAAQVAQGLEGAQLKAIYTYLDEADDQISCMRDLRTSVESAGIGAGVDTYPFMYAYIFYEQFAIIRKEAFVNLALALLAVFLITSTIIASVHASAMVIACIIMVDIDILGLMHMWGLTIDSVTIINLVLALGLTVDYSAHIAHAFVIAKGTRQQRADHALGEMGTAVVHGALSTFAAVLVLSTSKSYIFRVFFKQFFGICIFGAAHGLCFLPVMLSLIGPDQIELRGSTAFPVDGKKAATECSNTTEMMSVPTTPATQTPVSPPLSPPSTPTAAVPPEPVSVRVMRAWEAEGQAEEA